MKHTFQLADVVQVVCGAVDVHMQELQPDHLERAVKVQEAEEEDTIHHAAGCVIGLRE